MFKEYTEQRRRIESTAETGGGTIIVGINDEWRRKRGNQVHTKDEWQQAEHVQIAPLQLRYLLVACGEKLVKTAGLRESPRQQSLDGEKFPGPVAARHDMDPARAQSESILCKAVANDEKWSRGNLLYDVLDETRYWCWWEDRDYHEAGTLVAMATFSLCGSWGDLICDGSWTFGIYNPEFGVGAEGVELDVAAVSPGCVPFVVPFVILCIFAGWWTECVSVVACDDLWISVKHASRIPQGETVCDQP